MLVSIGFASCNGCHMMHEKCFCDAAVGVALARGFVCIKVDMEEHPEVDAFYQSVAFERLGMRGWPLNAFVAPAHVLADDGAELLAKGSPVRLLFSSGHDTFICDL